MTEEKIYNRRKLQEQCATREELLEIFGEMTNLPPEALQEANEKFEEKCIKTGIKLFKGENENEVPL